MVALSALDPEKIIREATNSLEEFQNVNRGEPDDVQRQQSSCPVVWERPPQGVHGDMGRFFFFFFFDIILEGDAIQIVTAIFTDLPNWSRFEHFIDEIQEQSLLLWSFRVSHVIRKANSVAHTLTKVASTQVRNKVWSEDFPYFLSDIVCKEAKAPSF